MVALLAAAGKEGTRAALGLRLAAVTGAREAEIVALHWADLNGDSLRIGRQRHSVGGEAAVVIAGAVGVRHRISFSNGLT